VRVVNDMAEENMLVIILGRKQRSSLLRKIRTNGRGYRDRLDVRHVSRTPTEGGGGGGGESKILANVYGRSKEVQK
jgi:hypothetical protein